RAPGSAGPVGGMNELGSAIIACISARVLACGNGASGTATPRAAQMGPQPSLGGQSTSCDFGTDFLTCALWRSSAALAAASPLPPPVNLARETACHIAHHSGMPDVAACPAGLKMVWLAH